MSKVINNNNNRDAKNEFLSKCFIYLKYDFEAIII